MMVIDFELPYNLVIYIFFKTLKYKEGNIYKKMGLYHFN